MTSLGPKRTVGLVVTHKSKMAASVGGNGSGRSVPHSRARSKIKRPGGCGGYTCCFPGCFNNHKKDPDLSFHSFPSGKSLEKQELRQKWIDIVNTAMGRKDFQPSSGHRVSLFRVSDILLELSEWSSKFPEPLLDGPATSKQISVSLPFKFPAPGKYDAILDLFVTTTPTGLFEQKSYCVVIMHKGYLIILWKSHRKDTLTTSHQTLEAHLIH